MKKLKIFTLLVLIPFVVFAQKPRARDIGIVAAETMEGINGNKAYGFPHKLVIDLLKK